MTMAENGETWRLRQLVLVILNSAALIVWYLVRPGMSCRVRRALNCNRWERTIHRRAWWIDLALDWFSTEWDFLGCCLAWWQFDCWWKSYHTCYCTIHHLVCSTRSSILVGHCSICKVDFPSHRCLGLKRRWIKKKESKKNVNSTSVY